jgi:hypothetical protein
MPIDFALQPSQFPLKCLVEQGLEQVLRLALGFALLGAQALEFVEPARIL